MRTGCRRERPFVSLFFGCFVLGLSCRGRRNSGIAAPHDKRFTRARGGKQKKMHDFPLIWRFDLLLSHKLEKATVADCEIPPRSRSHTHGCCEGACQAALLFGVEKTKLYFTCNNIARGDSLHLRLLSGQCTRICCANIGGFIQSAYFIRLLNAHLPHLFAVVQSGGHRPHLGILILFR